MCVGKPHQSERRGEEPARMFTLSKHWITTKQPITSSSSLPSGIFVGVRFQSLLWTKYIRCTNKQKRISVVGHAESTLLLLNRMHSIELFVAGIEIIWSYFGIGGGKASRSCNPTISLQEQWIVTLNMQKDPFDWNSTQIWLNLLSPQNETHPSN